MLRNTDRSKRVLLSQIFLIFGSFFYFFLFFFILFFELYLIFVKHIDNMKVLSAVTVIDALRIKA